MDDVPVVLVDRLLGIWRNLEYGSICKPECGAVQCGGINFRGIVASLLLCGLQNATQELVSMAPGAFHE